MTNDYLELFLNDTFYSVRIFSSHRRALCHKLMCRAPLGFPSAKTALSRREAAAEAGEGNHNSLAFRSRSSDVDRNWHELGL